MTDDKDRDQAPDANKAPGQQTPSRSYGRQVHDGPEETTATDTPVDADDEQDDAGGNSANMNPDANPNHVNKQ